MSASTKETETRSESASEITGKTETGSESASEITETDYHTGIYDGFLERNAPAAELLEENRKIFDQNDLELGDIDLLFVMTQTKNLIDLFPAHVARVQHNKTVEAGQKLFLEVTASTGTTIAYKRDNKLERKVNFYNALFTDGTVRERDLVVFVYNGRDPVEVKEIFDGLNPMFRGAVIYFPRKGTASWRAYERLTKVESAAAEREAALVAAAEREAALVAAAAEREAALVAAAAEREAALVAAAAELEAALVAAAEREAALVAAAAEREAALVAAAAEREVALERIRQLEEKF